MDSKIRMIGTLVCALGVVAGCESVALMPRPDVDDSRVIRNRADREPDVDRVERERRRASREVTGTVQRVDAARREIHLRTAERNLVVFRYDPNTPVYDRDRDLSVNALRNGDEIAVQPRGNSDYEQYAEVIRMIDRRSDARY